MQLNQIVKSIIFASISVLPLVANAANDDRFLKSGTVMLENYQLVGKKLYYYKQPPFSYSASKYGAVKIHLAGNSAEYTYEIDLKETNFVIFNAHGNEPGQGIAFCEIKFSDITPTSAHFEVLDNSFDGCGINPTNGMNWLAFNFHFSANT